MEKPWQSVTAKATACALKASRLEVAPRVLRRIGLCGQSGEALIVQTADAAFADALRISTGDGSEQRVNAGSLIAASGITLVVNLRGHQPVIACLSCLLVWRTDLTPLSKRDDVD